MRKIFLLEIVLVLLLFVSCASPEMEDETARTVLDNSKTLDIQAERGRKIVQKIEMVDSVMDIDADLIISSDQIEKGEFTQVLPSVDIIQKIFTEGEKMQKEKESDNCWILLSDNDSSIAFRSVYYLNNDAHMAFYENATIREFGEQHVFYEDKTAENCSQKEKKILDEYIKQAKIISESLGINADVTECILSVSEEKYHANISFTSNMDDVPVIHVDAGISVNHLSMAPEGIIGGSFYGSFEKTKVQSVNLMPVDDVIDVIKNNAEYLGNQASSIKRIQLFYQVDFDDYTFRPVWGFIDDHDFLTIIVDAESGEIL